MNRIDHALHLPGMHSYHRSDQVKHHVMEHQDLDSQAIPELVDINFFASKKKQPAESAYKKKLKQTKPLPLVSAVQILENQRAIPHSWKSYRRIYFPGTIARNSRGGLVVPFITQSPFIFESKAREWVLRFSLLIPNVPWQEHVDWVAVSRDI